MRKMIILIKQIKIIYSKMRHSLLNKVHSLTNLFTIADNNIKNKRLFNMVHSLANLFTIADNNIKKNRLFPRSGFIKCTSKLIIPVIPVILLILLILFALAIYIKKNHYLLFEIDLEMFRHFYSLAQENILNNFLILSDYFKISIYHHFLLYWVICTILLMIYNFIYQIIVRIVRIVRREKKEKISFKNIFLAIKYFFSNFKEIIKHCTYYITDNLSSLIRVICLLFLISVTLFCSYTYFFGFNEDMLFIIDLLRLYVIYPILVILQGYSIDHFILKKKVKLSDIKLYLKKVTFFRFIFIAFLYYILVKLGIYSMILTFILPILNDIFFSIPSCFEIISGFLVGIIKSHSYSNGIFINIQSFFSMYFSHSKKINFLNFLATKYLYKNKDLSINFLASNLNCNTRNNIKKHNFYYNLLFGKSNFIIKSDYISSEKNSFLDKKFYISKPVTIYPDKIRPEFILVKTGNSLNGTNLHAILPLKGNKIKLISSDLNFIYSVNNLNLSIENNDIKGSNSYTKINRFSLEYKGRKEITSLEFYNKHSELALITKELSKLKVGENEKDLLHIKAESKILATNKNISFPLEINIYNKTFDFDRHEKLPLSYKKDISSPLNSNTYKTSLKENLKLNRNFLFFDLINQDIDRNIQVYIMPIIIYNNSNSIPINIQSIQNCFRDIETSDRNTNIINNLTTSMLDVMNLVNNIKRFMLSNRLKYIHTYNNITNSDKIVLPFVDNVQHPYLISLQNRLEESINNLIYTYLNFIIPLDRPDEFMPAINWVFQQIGEKFPLYDHTDIYIRSLELARNLDLQNNTSLFFSKAEYIFAANEKWILDSGNPETGVIYPWVHINELDLDTFAQSLGANVFSAHHKEIYDVIMLNKSNLNDIANRLSANTNAVIQATNLRANTGSSVPYVIFPVSYSVLYQCAGLEVSSTLLTYFVHTNHLFGYFTANQRIVRNHLSFNFNTLFIDQILINRLRTFNSSET